MTAWMRRAIFRLTVERVGNVDGANDRKLNSSLELLIAAQLVSNAALSGIQR